MNEANIAINGITLTDSQSMTVRVALENLATCLIDPETRAATGHIAASYEARIAEIRRMLYRSAVAAALNEGA